MNNNVLEKKKKRRTAERMTWRSKKVLRWKRREKEFIMLVHVIGYWGREDLGSFEGDINLKQQQQHDSPRLAVVVRSSLCVGLGQSVRRGEYQCLYI